MSRSSSSNETARDLKRSALAVAMVLLKELDEAIPEKHGAREVAALLLAHQKAECSGSAADASDDHLESVLLALTRTIGRLLDVADDKCPEGSLKAMLLFKIAEDLAQEGYELGHVLDFVQRAHAGREQQDGTGLSRMFSGTTSGPASPSVAVEALSQALAEAAVRPSRAA